MSILWLWVACGGKDEASPTPPATGETGAPIADTSPDPTTPTPTTPTTDSGAPGDTADSGAPCGGAPATMEAFVEAYAEVFCEYWEPCNAQVDCPMDGTTTSSGPCNYDPVAAEQCLCGPWSCNTEFPGFEYVEPPAACAAVCG